MDVFHFSSVNGYSRRAVELSAARLAGRADTLCIYIQCLANTSTPRGIVAKTPVATTFAELGVQVHETLLRTFGTT